MRRFFLVLSIVLFAVLVLIGIHQRITNYGGNSVKTEKIGIINSYYNI